MATDMTELQSLVDSIRISGSPGNEQIDTLASAIESRLNIKMNKSAYRQMAEQMLHFNIDSPSRHSPPQTQHQQSSQGPSNGHFTINGSSNNTSNGKYNSSNGVSAPNYANIPQHPNSSFSSLGSPQRRGRSPARDVLSNKNKRNDTNATASSGIRGSSPIRHLFGGNKIPPSTTTTGGVKEPRASSPFNFFRRTTTNTKLNKSSDEKKAQEEKKDYEKDEKLRPGMRDQSPGASPHRLGSQRMHIPHVQQHQQHNNNVAYQPPKQIFQPPSPVRPPVTSRPVTPVGNITDRPPSRCSSPFSTRPGLQDDSEIEAISILGRSPGRAFESIPQTHNGLNVCSGMSSQHATSSAPIMGIGGGTIGGHRRIHSGGVDMDNDSISKPIPPRAHSRSPMRRPSEVDDDGGRQPVPPRAFSASPRGRSIDYVQVKDSANDQIRFPDLNGLSMPLFNTPSSSDATGCEQGLFTPPPNIIQPQWSNIDTDASMPDQNRNNVENSSNIDRRNGSSLNVQPRSDSAETSDVQFRCDFSSSKTSSQRLPNRLKLRSAHRSDQAPPRTPMQRDEMFSPMDIDEPSPVPPAIPKIDQPPGQHIDGIRFEVGIKSRAPRVQRRISETHPSDIPKSADSLFASPNGSSNKAASANVSIDKITKSSYIASKREEGNELFKKGDFRSSIISYSLAIRTYKEASAYFESDLLALLLSNRAAGLLMIGAYDAAMADCEMALRKVTPPRGNEALSNENGLLLKIKLSTRLAKAHLKLGDHNAASRCFNDAIRTGNTASQFSKTNHSEAAYQKNQNTINNLITDAVLGQSDAKRLRDACDKISEFSLGNMRFPSDRMKYRESYGYVESALSIASGSLKLIETKISLLVQMKRWREVAECCERLAAYNVGMDNVFQEDLAARNPFPGVQPAEFLTSSHFDAKRDENNEVKENKFNTKQSAEAALRLPYSITPIYLRALRLEERYSNAESALLALDDLIRRGTGVQGSSQALQTKFAWIAKERNKLEKTKEGRDSGDNYFRENAYEKAAAKYGECLLVDGMGLTDSTGDMTAGGRLHAVLHCNRAACLMPLLRYHAALDECTSALSIHPEYMKAILRRARCYAQLQRTQESISEFKRWLNYVDEAKKKGYKPTSSCLFDGPRTVSSREIASTQMELEDLLIQQRRHDAAMKEEAERLRDRERQKFQDNFSSSWRTSSQGNAHDRREQWYNDQGESRRWDSFSNRGPRSSSNPRSEFGGTSRNTHRSNSHGRSRHESLLSPRSNPADHYAILNLSPNATVDEIKKSFRKLALKYHPDKNTDDGASDNFRRIKLAHEVLIDPVKRRQFDSERLMGLHS